MRAKELKKCYLQVALPVPLRTLFDYLPPQELDYSSIVPGARVLVPFQNRKLIGIVIEINAHSNVPEKKLKKAYALLDSTPILPPDVYQLCTFAAQYYCYPLGEVLSSALPKNLRRPAKNSKNIKTKNPIIDKKISSCEIKNNKPELNGEQKKVLEKIFSAQNTFQVFLLEGITGSGKTEIYLRLIEKKLAEHKQILVLVPEISLTPQTIQRFRERFSVPIGTLHSAIADGQRAHMWQAAKTGTIKIIIGTRSALFTPFANLGLIVVDEEHDASFKQQDRFRYHARDLAIMRARINNIPIILGSATPSLESLSACEQNRYTHLSLSTRAGGATLPQFQIINMENTQEYLSPTLLHTMSAHLQNGNQVLLFLNRRGFAPVLFCQMCKHIECCPRCDAKMIYHHRPAHLQCHLCDHKKNIPSQCSECEKASLITLGFGTQKIEQSLENYFPNLPIFRIDRDSTRRKNSLQNLLTEVHKNKPAILLGTQMLAKGHHFPQVTLVGILDMDSSFFSLDFRAAEQMGQLLMQVSGRAGRAEQAGTVLIQTRQTQHVALQALIEKGYASYARNLLKERAQTNLPPYSYFVLLKTESYDPANALEFLNSAKNFAQQEKAVHFVGPFSPIIARKKGLYAHHLLLQAGKRSVLQTLLASLIPHLEQHVLQKTVRWLIDVDPLEIY